MKKALQCLSAAVSIIFMSIYVHAQNADEIIYNQYLSNYSYAGGSFVIDTGQGVNTTMKKAFLIWAANVKPDSLERYLSLSEYGSLGNYLNEKVSTPHKNATLRTLFPKKIIKSRYAHVYYLLGYVINSSHLLNNVKVYSSPVVYKIDGNTLNVIWASRIHLAAITANNAGTIIEYNDIIETKDGNIVLAGKYATSTFQKEYVLATKLFGAAGTLSWFHYYFFGNSCNEAANSVAETTDGNLSFTGYVRRCATSSFSGPTDMFYTQLTAAGIPVAGTYRKFPWIGALNLWGDKVTCYTNIAGNDNLVISGYVDMPKGISYDRQIFIANIKQNGNFINFFLIGDTLADVANDLIFQQQPGTQDYLLYLTGYTSNYNSTSSARNEVYFLELKFNAVAGVTGLVEFSTFPLTAPAFNTYTGRVGIEIKNASFYKRLAILTTGTYRPSLFGNQTYTNVLIRDFADQSGTCIRRFNPPVKQFTIDALQASSYYVTPNLKVYREGWTTLGPLITKQLCQQVKINPYEASLVAPVVSSVVSDAMSTNQKNKHEEIIVMPNPVKNMLQLFTATGESITNRTGAATINIYSSAMQPVQTMKITHAGRNAMSIPVDRLKPGVYFLQLIKSGSVNTVKFVKE